METLARHSEPISPTSEPSRAKTSVDCAGGTMRHGSPVDCFGASCAATIAGSNATTRHHVRGRRGEERRSIRGDIVLILLLDKDCFAVLGDSNHGR